MSATPGGTDDLASLSSLDEAILLEELKIRYLRNRIYTYIGDILVALNPFKNLEIYSKEYRKAYRNVQLAQNPPHIFAVADAAYNEMERTGKNQCFVISGESGAGKTETAKLLVSQLMELSNSRTILEQKIIQVNPLLEAFGNAKTVINNNSSRFGKYLQLKFQKGRVTGAKINEYLLEKSRVVSQSPQERNFHIFYYLFSGLSPARKTGLALDTPSNFHYLQNGYDLSSSPDEGDHFAEVCNALDLVGFETNFQEYIFTSLAAVLHLGNIKFNEDTHEYSYVLEPRSGPIQIASKMLGINVHHLMDILTVSTSFARGEVIKKHLNQQGSIASRDALAKALYDRLFRWIVNWINQLLAPTAADMVGEKEIGILDIFGFERFERNSFEQMCINVANEQLQYFFTEHIFLLEREEYRKEGVHMTTVQFHNNQPLLEMFLSKPLGILALLDEQCSVPRATDLTFVTKLSQVLKKKKSDFFVPSKDTVSGHFSIVHFAGKVEYDSQGFLEKNRDRIPNGAVELLKTSTNDLIKLIFTADITRTGTLVLNKLTTLKRLKAKSGKEPKKRSVAVGTSKHPTVGAQFKSSLSVLIEKMNAACPHFVRCIKPNTQKSPDNFHTETVVTQLRNTGMLQTVEIRRDGFPYRPTFAEFMDKYGIITDVQRVGPSSAESCKEVLEKAGLDSYCIGKTKVFLKLWHLDRLSGELARVHRAVVMVQKLVRGFVERSKFKQLMLAKQEQETAISEFLLCAMLNVEELYLQQIALCEADQENPIPSAPPLQLLPAPPPPSAPPPSVVMELMKPRPVTLPPPPDLNMPPPEPFFRDLEEDFFNSTEEETNEEEIFVAPVRYDTYGREGTKLASKRWFEETQAESLRIGSSGLFPEWFHGPITRRKAEELLRGMPDGSFLVRLCANRFGFSISVRDGLSSHRRTQDRANNANSTSTTAITHHMISQLETGKYVIVGELRVHSHLQALVNFYHKNPISTTGKVLTQPCKLIPAPTPAAAAATDERVERGGVTEGVAQRGGAAGKRLKLSRTRSHDPQLGYGGLKSYISKKNPLI